MNRLPLIILACLVLGAAAFGIAQLNEVQKLQHTVNAWEKERADLQKRIWELQKRNRELENRPVATETSPAVAATAGDPAVENQHPENNEAPPPPRPRDRNGADRFAALMANPEAQKLLALQQKASLDGHFADLFRQLHLNPADLEKFKGLLVEKQSAVMDVMAAARAQGLNPRENRDEFQQLVQNARNEVDNNIRSTLGDAVYAQYQSYEVTAPQRAVVSQLDQRLSYSSTPLSDTQSQQLVQILAQTGKTNNNSDRAGGGGPGGFAGIGGGGTTITADAITQAQGVLSTDQLSALKALQQEQQASAQLKKEMRANFKK